MDRLTINPRQAATKGQTEIIQVVRSAVAEKDFRRAKQLERAFRTNHGPTPEGLEALSWLARVAWNAGRIREAVTFAQQAHRLALYLSKRRGFAVESHLATALGAAIEVLAQAMGKQGERAKAVRFLKEQFARFHTTVIAARIQKNLNLLALEGQPAPALIIRSWLGPKPLSLAKLRGRPVLLFFWAHYCDDSRTQCRVLVRICKQFGAAGLALIGATRRYGYLDEYGRKPADPYRETEHIKRVINKYYKDLPDMPVIISKQNFVAYGASTTPTLVLVDRGGLVDLYHPGKMAFKELDRRTKLLFDPSSVPRSR